MDIVDRELIAAELDAASTQRRASLRRHPSYQTRHSHEIERITTAASTSSSSSITTSSSANPVGLGLSSRTVNLSRVSTQSDLDRCPTELSRIATARSQHSATVGWTTSSRRKQREPLPEFGAGKPYPPPLPDREEYVVEFDGPDDPLHAQNWPLKRKILTTAVLCYTTTIAIFGSSIFSPAVGTIAEMYNVSRTISVFASSAYILGFAIGPTFWAPLSELQGRRLPIAISMFGFTIFMVAVGASKDIQSITICRFFGGVFAAGPLAVVPAIFSDMYDNSTRGVAVTCFAVTVFIGPMLGPPVGGYIVESDLGWRWTQFVAALLGAIAFALDFALLDETYPPVILVCKAAELRRRTRNWGIHAKQEEIEVDFGELISKNFSRPMRILFGEPVVLWVSIYMAFIYGLLYLFLTAYPVVFQSVYGFGLGESGLPFLGMIVGQVLAAISILLQQPWYQRKLAANNGIPVPEWRLPSAMAGGIAFAGGLFWFAWTGYRPDTHWIVPTVSGILTGFGLFSIFIQSLNYLVDSYLMFAASAVAGNTFLRSLAGAGFPLFAGDMFDAMGINWACTMLGCVALVLIPIPVCFYLYGPRLRARSAIAPALDLKGAPEDDRDEKDLSEGSSEQQGAAPRTEREAV